ncbi:hypothetical protein L873DRAFT_1008913 [Choiromyces venosus 120613-1]|uniref:RBR-type E3 ubiquitin transferase n=1 Tax=Choiromyces venosus 120613-1 TaxID=1336337 RepID=A0A3N4JKF6_9PEZI|nr:hypothetical protein L873DRAFT_1008913 [Choiromyces venosus 120613-1]
MSSNSRNRVLPSFFLLQESRPFHIKMTSSQASLLHRFACIICMENKQTSSASPAISPSCKHQSNVCKPCLQMHIRTALSTKFASSEPPLPKCLQCPSEITHEYVQKSFPTLASTYSDYLLQAYLLTIPDYRPCLQSGCSSGQFHSGREEQPIATCPKCSGKSCFTCRIPWHASRTCAEVKEEERVNEELFEKITKICPGCGIRVEKADGCDHMTCRCKTEWCWLCRASYGPIRTLGNEGHRRKCPHWRGPTGEMPVVPVVQVGILAPVQAAP